MSLPENPALNPTYRADLRRVRMAAREAIPADRHAQLSAAVHEHLQRLLASRSPGVLAFCWPIRAEFDCRPLARQLIDRGWQSCIPTVVEGGAPMEFRAWTPNSTMAVDRHGIPVPADGATLIPDVVLLPLVAFDAKGFRLGYGGGYFDRTLAVITPRPLAIGVGFEVARVDSIQPQAHDIPLDVVVTEVGVNSYAPR